MNSTSNTEEPIPWYRPVLRIVERAKDWDYIILGSGLGLLVIVTMIMICCCRCASQRRRKRHLEKRIAEEADKNTTHDLIIQPSSSLYQQKSGKQDSIFRRNSETQDPQETLNSMDDTDLLLKQGLIFTDVLPASIVKSSSRPGSSKNTTATDADEQDDEEGVLETTVASTGVRSVNSQSPKSMTSAPPTQFRLPPIDMAHSSFKMGRLGVATPVLAPVVAKVNPVFQVVPTPPTSPMPADSISSSTESLFDNVVKKKSAPATPRLNSAAKNVAFSSIARKLFPLNSEFLSFLAKEGLHQDWQIYTLNNRAIEAFLYKYVIFISDADRQQFLTGIMLTRILIQIHARDAESSIEQARSRQTQISLNSLDASLQQEAWSVSRTCPIGFGSYSPRRDLLLDFEKAVPNIKHLLLTRGICGLTHLEQLFANHEKAEDLISQAEQLILSGDITVAGMDSLLRLMDGISLDATMHEFVKAQEDWDIEGGNAVEPRIVKRAIRTAVNILKSNSISKGLYQFHQTSTKVDLSMKRKFEITGKWFAYFLCFHLESDFVKPEKSCWDKCTTILKNGTEIIFE